MTNSLIADELLRQARSAAETGQNLYRVQALRRAAMAVQALDLPVATILADIGINGLLDQPGIGPSLAKRIKAIAERN